MTICHGKPTKIALQNTTNLVWETSNGLPRIPILGYARKDKYKTLNLIHPHKTIFLTVNILTDYKSLTGGLHLLNTLLICKYFP